LLSGLEATEVRVSEADKRVRLDAEYFNRTATDLEAKLKRSPYSYLGDEGDFVPGPFGSEFHVENFSSTRFRYIRGKDVKPFVLQDNDNVYIPEEDFKRLAEFSLEVNDILVSVVGTLGNAAIARPEDLPAVFSCKSTVFRPKRLNPWFVLAYLNSTVGNKLLLRNARGTVQTGLNLPDLRTLPIPKPSTEFEREVSVSFSASHKSWAASKTLFGQALVTLEASLGIRNLSSNDNTLVTKRASEVWAADRLDAEYFRPRYQSLLALLRQQGSTLRDVARVREDMFTPQPGQPFHYIEIGDLAADGAATSHVVPGEEAPSRATWLVQPGDIITSTVRPIRCLTGLVEPEQAGQVCSSGFAVLTPKGIPSELLFAYLRLPVMCELMDLHTTASMYPAISTGDLMRLPFLLPDEGTVRKVKQQVTAARAARREAHGLLERAKRAVEIAIEENEAAGMAYLK
jgi:hypothetical protein